jgi:hypothetical protein
LPIGDRPKTGWPAYWPQRNKRGVLKLPAWI